MCECPSPSQGDASRSASMATSRASSETRGLRSPALCWWALSGWPAAGISWRRTRNGQNPRPHRPAGGRRPNPCRESCVRHSSPHDLRRIGKGPDCLRSCASSRLPPSTQINSARDPLHGDVQLEPSTGSPLRSLSEASISGDRLLTPLLEPENLRRPTAADKSSTGSPRKSRRATVTLCDSHRSHRWPSRPERASAGRNLARGKRGRFQASPSFTTGPSTATSRSQNCRVMFAVRPWTRLIRLSPIRCAPSGNRRPTHPALYRSHARPHAELESPTRAYWSGKALRSAGSCGRTIGTSERVDPTAQEPQGPMTIHDKTVLQAAQHHRAPSFCRLKDWRTYSHPLRPPTSKTSSPTIALCRRRHLVAVNESR